MKLNKIITTALLFGAVFFPSFAYDVAEEFPTLINLEEVEVRVTRETTALRQQPVSYTFLSGDRLERTNLNSLGTLSAVVPNFVMPDYGARITSTIFVRGIGSRMNEPSVGLYVDDIPIMDKSGFDFDFFDIRSIEFLRGPQGTLYGRNAIGGLIRINTLSAFDFQGTRWFASLGNFGDIRLRASYYGKVNENLAISYGISAHRNTGFFKNEYRDEKDFLRSFNGRFRLEWRINPLWNLNFSLNSDLTRQNAFPYAPFDIETGEIGIVSFNEQAAYQRDIINLGLSLQRRSENLLFTSATSYQFLDDEMRIDQDFTPEPILALTQKQRINAFTQEFVFRSRGTSNYQWVAGAFGFYKNSAVNAPLTFHRDALRHLTGGVLPAFIVSRETVIPGQFDIPTFGVALYHQSSYRLWDRLTLTAGLRVEHERTSMDFDTHARMILEVRPPMPPNAQMQLFHTHDSIYGNIAQNFFAVLPKFALVYDINDRHSVFATISRGHKTGGFNFQMFGSVMQQNLMSQMPSMGGMVMPEPIDKDSIRNMIAYRPEFTVNYEIGLRSELIPNRLFTDVAIFYIDYTDQQIVTFSSTNLGARRMENAGRSRSLGAEASVRARITNHLFANVAYGFTHATFREFDDIRREADGTWVETNFAGNFLPLVPRNTLSASAEYFLPTENIRPLRFLDNVVFRAQYNGVGKIYFTEENLISQDFYGTVNGSISFVRNDFSLNFWASNLFDTEFKTFYFTSLNNHFVQRGRPRQVGVSMNWNF